jgi:Lipocalin-like domain
LSFLAAIALTLAVGFSSCSKDDDDPKSKEELMAQGSWKFKSATTNGAPYTSFPNCQTDNILSFNLAGTGVLDEGSTKCNAGDPQTRSFNWSLINNKTEIQLSTALFENSGTTVTLNSVTDTQLVITVGVATPGPVIAVQITFEH